MKDRNRFKTNLWLLFISLIVIILIGYISIALFFPSNITIRRGEASLLDFDLPLKGDLFVQDMAVSVNSDKTVTDNIFCLFKNYLSCDDIETVIFPYGFHGDRKPIYDEVIRRLRDEGIVFAEHIVILKCEYEQNNKRCIKDNRDTERIERGMKNTFNFYDELEYPTIDTTFMSPGQVSQKIIELFFR